MQPYYDHAGITIYHGDCRDILPTLDPASVHTCVTSPPYFGLRDYAGEHQIGLEASPAAYFAVMREVFELVRGALRPDGTCWLNLGDSYNTQPAETLIQADFSSGHRQDKQVHLRSMGNHGNQ